MCGGFGVEYAINPNYLLNSVEAVLSMDLPETAFAFALNAHVNLMAGVDPEQVIGLSLS